MLKPPAWVYCQNSRNWMYQGSRPGPVQFSLLTALDLPTIPPPTTTSPFRHGRFDTLPQCRDWTRLSRGQTDQVAGIAVARSRVRNLLASSPTGLAESSSLALRTGRSPPIALHLPSRERSYLWLQARNADPEGTFTLLIKRLHRRTSHARQSVGDLQKPS